MDNALMVGLSAQRVLRRRLDVVANNLANLGTTAFKAESLLQREVSERPATSFDKPGKIAYADDWALQRDMSTGPLRRTGNAFDVAVDGEGFFVATGPDGTDTYTRNGRLQIDGEGTLITRAGGGEPLPIQGEGGAALAIDPDGGQIVITGDGQISQDGTVIGRLRMVRFATPAALEKAEGGLWRRGPEAPEEADTPRFAQGFVEDSNVQAIFELTRLIEITRAYEGVARMLSQTGQLRKEAIRDLANVNQ